METIGQRAAYAIKLHGIRLGTNAVGESDRLDIPRDNFYAWKNGRSDPSAYYLKKMVLAGYDVLWILTGKENKNDN